MFTGELLEKATRVLTVEEKAILETEWVGRDGSKRKLEVRLSSALGFVMNFNVNVLLFR